MKICQCDTPKPYENVHHKTTNVCQTCGGKIRTEKEKKRDLGTLHVRVDGAILNLPCEDETRAQFLEHLVDTLGGDIEQKFKTWRNNRATPKDVQQAQEIDAARRGKL